MENRTLLKTGIVGSVAAALCCATPILVILFGVMGLSAWVGWLDYVLIPALVVFIGITIYALYPRGASTPPAALCRANPKKMKEGSHDQSRS